MKDFIKYTELPDGRFFCQYYGQNKTIHGVGAFGENWHMAEHNMWEMVHEIEKRQLEISPTTFIEDLSSFDQKVIIPTGRNK